MAMSRTTELMTWFRTGTFEAHWALRVDQLTAVMLVVVTGVSAMVHVYSVGYMAMTTGRSRASWPISACSPSSC